MPLYFSGSNPTADMVVLTADAERPEVLLVRRRHDPFEGSWAIPGGFIESAAPHGGVFRLDVESPRQAAVRELSEETGVSVAPEAAWPIAIFDAPGRDPRGDVVSHAFVAVHTRADHARAGDDAADARWFEVRAALDGKVHLAFDHLRILRAALAVAALGAGRGAYGPPDLRDHPAALHVRKHPLPVEVWFAAADGLCPTREGEVRYRAGDALLRAQTGESWPVARERFDASYQAASGTTPGTPGTYVKRPLDVVALRLDAPYAVRVGYAADPIHGAAGDWLLQYGIGDYGIVAADLFGQSYSCGPRVLDGVCRPADGA